MIEFSLVSGVCPLSKGGTRNVRTLSDGTKVCLSAGKGKTMLKNVINKECKRLRHAGAMKTPSATEMKKQQTWLMRQGRISFDDPNRFTRGLEPIQSGSKADSSQG